MRGAAIVIGLLCVGSSGCWVSSHEPTDPLPLSRFCDELFRAVCDPLIACDCGETAVALCRAEQQALCVGFPTASVHRAVDEGRLRYDGHAAARLVTRLGRRAQACASFADAVDWQVRDLFSIGGVFEGTVEAGEPCAVLGFELISECALGSCAPTEGGRVCRAVVGPGERCDSVHQCVDLDAPVATATGLEELALRCVAEDGASAGTCARRLEEGAACAGDGECASGRCADGRCRAAALDEACTSARECASRYCDEARRCALGDAPVGASCVVPIGCASRVCVDGVCLPAACGTF